MSKQPLLILAICFITGIALQELSPISWAILSVLGAIAAGASLLSLLKRISIQRLKPFINGFTFFVLGIGLHFLNTMQPQLPNITGNRQLVFHLDKKLNSNEKNRRYEVVFVADGQEIPGVVSVPKKVPELDFAHWYQGEFRINELKSPENDFQFDYARYMSRKYIFFQGFLYGSLQAAERKELSIREEIKQNRNIVLHKINEAPISSRSREFMKGIILADRTEMDSQTIQDFSRSGLVHILAISGTHTMIIFGLFLFLLKKLLPAKFQKIALVSSLVFIWIFAVYIGMGSSVVRACIMLSTYYGFKILQRKTDALHAMSLAALAILLADTHQLFDVGFQLSFLAVLGIIWLNKPILQFLPKPRNNFQKWMVNIPSITMSAQLMTLPLVLFYFHQFSAISFIANLVVIPFSEIFIIGSLLSTVVIALGLEIEILQVVYDILVQFLLDLIHGFATLNSGFWENVAMHWSETAVLLLIVFLIGLTLRTRKAKSSLWLCLSVAFFLILRFGLDHQHSLRSEQLVHRYYKNKVVSVKEENQVVFFVPENAELEQVQKYLINPYLTSRRIKSFEIRSLPKNVSRVTWNGKTLDLEN